MIDIDAEFRKAMGIHTTANASSDDKPLTLDMLRDAKQKLDALGPPPPQVRMSRHVPVLGEANPSCEALTDDMRQMVEDIGPQSVPVAWRLTSDFGDMLLVNPANLKETSE